MPRKIPLLGDAENSDYPSYPSGSINDMEAVYMPSITSTEKPVNLFGVLSSRHGIKTYYYTLVRMVVCCGR